MDYKKQREKLLNNQILSSELNNDVVNRLVESIGIAFLLKILRISLEPGIYCSNVSETFQKFLKAHFELRQLNDALSSPVQCIFSGTKRR